MRKKIVSVLCCGLLLLLAGCGGSGGGGGTGNNNGGGGGGVTPTPDPPSPPDITYYTNPVFEPVFADPTIIRGDDGMFYAYATSDTSRWDGERKPLRTAFIPTIRSENLVDWEYVGDVFTSATFPQWAKGRGLWAPDIVKIGDTYNLYYSAAKWANWEFSSVGVCTAPTPSGPWTDHGEIVSYQNTGVKQSIDSYTFVYEGGVYMIWGSYYGIFWIELSSDGLTIKPGAKATPIGGTKDHCAYEGSWLIQHDDYWYLLVSYGNCCEGLNTNYYVQSYRATSPFGPYYGEDGKAMLGNDRGLGTNVIRNGPDFVGCGHNSMIKDDNGDDWIVYHAYDLTKSGTVEDTGTNRRALCIDKIYWDGGWPHTKNHFASGGETEAPYIEE